MPANDHSLLSSYREMLLEHLFAGEVMRHVQLKATFRGSTVNRFNVNTGLTLKPSGCVVVLRFDPDSLELGPFHWLGGLPGQPLPDLTPYPVAKHTKGNAQGVKLPRLKLKSVPLSAFEKVATIEDLAERLFGKLPKP